MGVKSERRVLLPGGAQLVVTWDAEGALPGVAMSGAAPFAATFAARLRQLPGPLLTDAGNICRRAFRRNFAEGGRPTWAQLAPSTVKARQKALAGGHIPRLTPRGRIPRRLTQVDRATGARSFGATTILIATGRLRDSWSQRGVTGNVHRVDGLDAFFGSQLTAETQISARTRIRPLQVVSRQQRIRHAAGGAAAGHIPLARIHELGAPKAHIPARPVARLAQEDRDAITAAAIGRLFGDQ